MKYKLDLSSFNTDKKAFTVGRGRTVVLSHGAILEESHKVVEMYPQYCFEIADGEEVVVEIQEEEKTKEPELLLEDPIEEAVVEIQEEVTEETPIENSVEDLLELCETKEDIEALVESESIEVNFGRTKDVQKLKEKVLSAINA